MPLKGKSFSINTGSVDKIVGNIMAETKKINKSLLKKVTASTEMVYATARTRRPYITMIGNSKVTTYQGMRKSKNKGARIVSDPTAKFGVPVKAQGGGVLRASIEKEIQNKGNKVSGRVYTDSPYAKFLEYGTSKMAARPFIGPALFENRENIKRIFQAKNA